jgi:uncharacterized protein (TIGR03085 family)
MAERAAMLDLAERLGPDAPTLCTGWTAYDLLAHVWVREHDLTALPGLVLPALHGITARRERSARERIPFGVLVGILRAGMPLLPLGLPGARESGNVHEFFVHHEDLRRANGLGPRPADPARDAALWRRLKLSAPVLVARARPLRVRLERPDGGSIDATPMASGARVTVRGTVPELFLWSFGRTGAAEVTFDGPPGAVAALRAARIGP